MEFTLTDHVSNKFIFLWFSPNKHYTWFADPVVMYVAKIDCSIPCENVSDVPIVNLFWLNAHAGNLIMMLH